MWFWKPKMSISIEEPPADPFLHAERPQFTLSPSAGPTEDDIYQLVRLALRTPMPTENVAAYIGRMERRRRLSPETHRRLVDEGILPAPSILRDDARKPEAATDFKGACRSALGREPTPSEYIDFLMGELKGVIDGWVSPPTQDNLHHTFAADLFEGGAAVEGEAVQDPTQDFGGARTLVAAVSKACDRFVEDPAEREAIRGRLLDVMRNPAYVPDEESQEG